MYTRARQQYTVHPTPTTRSQGRPDLKTREDLISNEGRACSPIGLAVIANKRVLGALTLSLVFTRREDTGALAIACG